MSDSADVFLVAGQSNAEGTGDPADAPTVPDGVAYEYCPETDDLVHLAEPVGSGVGGSAWTAFAAEYHERTGRTVAVVPMAVGGAAQHPDADVKRGAGHWRAGSDYCQRAVQAVTDCRARLSERGVDPAFRGILWHQGESDAIAIEEGYHSLDVYRDAFREMLGYFREAFDAPDLDLFLFQIGRPRDGDTPAWQAVRDAQRGFADGDDHVHVVFEDAVTFAEDGRMQDELHYTQTGYDEMGRRGAAAVADVLDAA